MSRRRHTPPDHRAPGAFAGLAKRLKDREGPPMCPECQREPSINGGRCFTCRARSMMEKQ